MKKLFMVAALLGFFAVPLTGCGGHEEKVIEEVSESDTGLSDDQQKAYEESMKSGAYNSSPSSQPKK